jgi:hypothetical protein
MPRWLVIAYVVWGVGLSATGLTLLAQGMNRGVAVVGMLLGVSGMVMGIWRALQSA